jgi:hypothetical protein
MTSAPRGAADATAAASRQSALVAATKAAGRLSPSDPRSSPSHPRSSPTRPRASFVAWAGRALIVASLCGASAASAGSAVDWTRVSPDVVRVDRTSPVTITAAVSGGTPTAVQFAAADGTTRLMRDDGIGADAVARDHIYTVQIDADLATGNLQPSDVFRKFVGFVDVYEGATRTSRVFVQTQVWTPAIGSVGVVNAGADVQYSNHVVNIVDRTTFAAGPNADFRGLVHRLYDYFPDSFDFVDVVFQTGIVANRYHFGVKNVVSGIGSGIFDNSFDYGSNGRLLGLTIYPASDFFDGGQEAHSHEIGHQWINFLKQTTLATGTPHWPLSSLANGLMGFSIPGSGAGGDYGCRLTPVATGIELTSFSGARTYTDLDLYLMGLKPASQVGDHYVWINQQAALNQNCLGVVAYSQFRKIGINDVIASTGARNPAWPNAQRDFKVAVIVLSDAKLSPEAMAFYDFFAQRVDARSPLDVHQGFYTGTGHPFYVATSGLGTMSARVRDGPGAGTYVTVYEFYAPSLDHYFRTASSDEASALASDPGSGWQPTGGDFKAYAANDHPGTSRPVCRFYGSVSPGPNSHFYPAQAAECAALRLLEAETPPSEPRWNYEEVAFAIDVPGATGCPASAPVPVYRAYNQRALENDSNHRYTTSLATYQQMLARGWKGEGVVMCAPS